MLIYILHSDKYYTFRLPKEISGSHILNDYDHNGEKRGLVNIVASDSKWIINSNETVKIIQNNKYVNSAELVPNSYYLLETDKGEKILLSTQLGYDDNYIIKEANNGTKITIGNDEKCDIIYNLSNIAKQQLSMEYKNGCWIVTNLESKIPVYVNKVRTDHIVASNFDCVFVLGLKIVLCGPLLFINNSNKLVTHIYDSIHTYQPKLIIGNVKDTGTYHDFYNPDDYFFKSPVFVKRNMVTNVPIATPDSKEHSGRGSFLLELIPSIIMQLSSVLYFMSSFKDYKAGNIDRSSFMLSLVMVVSMLFLGFVWPFIERFIEKIHSVIREKRRVSLYKKYLKGKREFLEKAREDQRTSLLFNYLSLNECQDTIVKKNTNLFSISPEQERFLQMSIGTGKVEMDCKIDYQKPDFLKEKDKLLDMIDKLVEDFKYVDNAPFVTSFKQNIAFINKNKEFYKYYEAIILKLITFYDYSNLKIVAFTSKNSRLNNIRTLNHCWDNEKSIRYIANDIQEAETLSSNLMRTFNSRSGSNKDQNSIDLPYYFVICDDVEKYKNIQIISSILKEKRNLGFSVISFSDKITNVSEGFDTFIDYDDTKASLFKSEMQENSIMNFTPELMTENINYDMCVRRVSNIPIKINDEISGMLPEKLGFLEMFGVGNVNQLNVINRWKDPKVINSLSTPIGVDSNNNTLYLDLHEKKHGPHGLIAGMTGSGKSEFIVTYILSLAINYSPEEVQFVLIDYKGGGLAGAFENRKTGIKLPHLVGTITNLDVSEMNRTLVSIKSELERRQRIFNEVKDNLNTGNLDIYKYQSLYREGAIEEPLSHLFIICDEFAELKESQPEFMDEIVSTSRIGRSLGIHLILATQKPAGVVDEQVWSNSKFKVCCKVQTTEDSKEMIRRDDAAYLKQAGRFYLQVGYDEYFVLGQSGYSGTAYVPSETAVSRFDNSVSFVSDLGEVYKKSGQKEKEEEKKEKETKNLGEELNNILKYIIDAASKEGYKDSQLWLDNVPEVMYYDGLIKKYNPQNEVFNINPVIGEYDNPRNQAQGIVRLPLTYEGNTYIIGSSRSGKNTLLSTMIYSTILTHASEEVNIYILDFGAEKLKKFEKAPQVGEVLTIENPDKIKYLFYMLQIEQIKRQKYYSENGGEFLHDVKKGSSPFPNILVIIYDVDVFMENNESIFENFIAPMSRNSSKYGINFIVTGIGENSLPYSVANNFPQKICLNLTDSDGMSTYFYGAPVIKKNPGRGLVQINAVAYEFQVPLIFEEDQEIESLAYVIEQLNEHLKTKAVPVPFIPDRVTIEHLADGIGTLDRVPLGVNLVTAQLGYFNFDSLINIMMSVTENTVAKFMNGLLQVLVKVSNTKVIVLSALGEKIKAPKEVKVYDSSFKKVIPVLSKNIEKYNSGEKSGDDKFLIIVLGYTKLNGHMTNIKKKHDSINTIDELVAMSKENNNFRYLIYDIYEEARLWRSDKVFEFLDTSSGIWVGKGFDDQSFIDVNAYRDDVPMTDEVVVPVIYGDPAFLKSIK